jgi:hypothetical protein
MEAELTRRHLKRGVKFAKKASQSPMHLLIYVARRRWPDEVATKKVNFDTQELAF